MGMAGHSMTLVDETKLVIIGGFSTTKYFSDTVYEFDANSYLTAWQTHKWDNVTGAKPTGMLGAGSRESLSLGFFPGLTQTSLYNKRSGPEA